MEITRTITVRSTFASIATIGIVLVDKHFNVVYVGGSPIVVFNLSTTRPEGSIEVEEEPVGGHLLGDRVVFFWRDGSRSLFRRGVLYQQVSSRRYWRTASLHSALVAVEHAGDHTFLLFQDRIEVTGTACVIDLYSTLDAPGMLRIGKHWISLRHGVQ